ncbi:uncharacterized protein LOC122498943, partial [Leptopilina heterotoma]|uniref:uncharacterized protein LOC122498943 n=1 Tax=Leptopilina heterotoma TaxID=63436 RepID=UPI001CA9D7F7
MYSGSGATNYESSWKYFNLMGFLVTFPLNRETDSNFRLPKRRREPEADIVEVDDDTEDDKRTVVNSSSDDDLGEIEEPSNSGNEMVENQNNYFLAIRDCWKRVSDKNKI